MQSNDITAAQAIKVSIFGVHGVSNCIQPNTLRSQIPKKDQYLDFYSRIFSY